MSRFSHWVNDLLHYSSAHESVPGLAVDMGSAQTKVAMKEKVVFHQPTCIALHRKSGEVIAIGQAAADLLGKTPSHIEVVFPVRRGKVQDITAAQLFLQISLQTILRQNVVGGLKLSQVFHPSVILAVPTHFSTAEKNMMQKLFREIHFPRVTFMTQLEAAYYHLQKQKKVGRVFALVNIGAMTTEMAFFAQGEVVMKRTLMLGGDDFTQVVLREVQKQYHCQIGWQTAERLKIQIGFDDTQRGKKMVVRGRDILNSLPTTIQVSAEDLTHGYQQLITDIVQNIADLFQDAAPEVMAEGLDQGVMLTGGGSLLTGLATVIEKKLRSPMHLSATAQEDVIRGMQL